MNHLMHKGAFVRICWESILVNPNASTQVADLMFRDRGP